MQTRFAGGAVLLAGLKLLQFLQIFRNLSTFILIIQVRVLRRLSCVLWCRHACARSLTCANLWLRVTSDRAW